MKGLDENIDHKTVAGFGEEWSAFDQTELPPSELKLIFDDYFSVFPFGDLPQDARGFDLGCGSGRWAELMSARVGHLHCIDASDKALDVARRRLAGRGNVSFHHAGADSIPLPDGSQDFGYTLGVLHHIPDTRKALSDCVVKLKRGAPLLVYLYYNFDNKPAWFGWLWRSSDLARRIIARLPFALRKAVTTLIAAAVYWPVARVALILERFGVKVDNLPLAPYRRYSFYTMRTDALDRFGTRLEQRFSRAQIESMMRASGLTDIVFRDGVPFWVACGRKS